MSKLMVSFFNNFPEYNGRKIEIRGKDGYFSATDMSAAMGKRFTDWRKTKFSQDLLTELSAQSRLPIDWENSPSRIVTPLVDYVRGDGQKVWIHPYVAMSYAMSDPIFQARVNIWIVDLMTIGTVNPHILQWTQEQFERGVEFNRDDINDLYR